MSAALTSSASKPIHGSSGWKMIHQKLCSRISNAAAPHLASGASHHLQRRKFLSHSGTDWGFHLSEENETVTNHCLFCWQVHAYDNHDYDFSPGELLPTLAWQWLIKYLWKLRRVVPVPTVCHCCRQVTGLKKKSANLRQLELRPHFAKPRSPLPPPQRYLRPRWCEPRRSPKSHLTPFAIPQNSGLWEKNEIKKIIFPWMDSNARVEGSF